MISIPVTSVQTVDENALEDPVLESSAYSNVRVGKTHPTLSYRRLRFITRPRECPTDAF